MPKSPGCVVRRGESYLFRRRPPVYPSLARRAPNTRPHMVVALRTRDRREAARLNVMAEAGWALEIPDDEVRTILRALTARVASLPDMRAAAKVHARCDAWNHFERQPHVIASIASREWVTVIQ